MDEIEEVKKLQQKYGLTGGNFADTEGSSEATSTLSLVKDRRKKIKKGFFAETKEDIGQVFSGIVTQMDKRREGVEEINQLQEGGQGFLRTAAQKAGQVA
jgi:t-SNARE complex subunit (syntaxin)